MADSAVLARDPAPTRTAVLDALGGVLCRCTGYQNIIDAVLDVAAAWEGPLCVPAVRARLPKVDGAVKLIGSEHFGADALPEEPVLSLRAVRSQHALARFSLGDSGPVLAAHPGLARVLTAADVPGRDLQQAAEKPLVPTRTYRIRWPIGLTPLGRRNAWI